MKIRSKGRNRVFKGSKFTKVTKLSKLTKVSKVAKSSSVPNEREANHAWLSDTAGTWDAYASKKRYYYSTRQPDDHLPRIVSFGHPNETKPNPTINKSKQNLSNYLYNYRHLRNQLINLINYLNNLINYGRNLSNFLINLKN